MPHVLRLVVKYPTPAAVSKVKIPTPGIENSVKSPGYARGEEGMECKQYKLIGALRNG
jgi:hypothetical protein